MYDGDGDAGVSGPRLARDGEDARQPGEPVAAKRIVDQLVGDDPGVERTEVTADWVVDELLVVVGAGNGTTPPTSQLDWLSSTTAMIVLFWSRATRDLLKSFGRGIAALHRLMQRRSCHFLAARP